MSADGDLLVRRQGGVIHAVFNRPAVRNALTFAMYDALADLCMEIDADEGARVLVLSGAGGAAFAAGTDIAQFDTFQSDADALAYEARIEHVLRCLEDCRVPTLAALAGACTGGGAAIASACDLRIAATNLRFGFPIARTLGNCLSAANIARLVALAGEARTKEMLFLSRLYDAHEALAAGLVSEVVPVDDLESKADALAALLMGQAPLTLRSTKTALRRHRAAVTPSDDLVLACYRSRDFKEGVAAFREKRRPDWRGC